MKRRRRAQGLVEYGLIAATVALVGAAGLNALTTAQKNYFTDLPMNPPAPSAPGALLHPTNVDAPVCPQAPTVAIGQPIVCNAPVVRDTFSNASGRNPPWGTITLHMDTDPTVLATCILGHPPSGSLNTCGSNLSWTPTDTSLAGSTHTLSLWYGLGRGYVPGYPPLPDPESNHVASISSSLSITFLQYQFNGVPQCQNGSGNNHVEVGSPIRCTAAIYDTSTMGPPSVPVAVTWTAVNDPGNGTGSPYLSCSTGGNVANFGSMIWSNPATPACSPGSTLTCMTDASGACSVVFRRVRALMGASPLTAGYQDFTVSAFNGGSVTSGTVAWPGRAINIDPPSTAHPTTTLMMCTPAASGQPPGTIFSPPPATGSFMQRHASLTWTSDLYIRGPAGKGNVK